MNKSEILLSFSNFATLPFVSNFNSEALMEWTSTSYGLPIGCAICYLLFSFIGYKMIRFQRALDLQMDNLLWNAAVCVFSFVGMCRTLPVLLSKAYAPSLSIFDAVCGDGNIQTDGAGAFWMALFVLGRILLLLDTFFIILRKKPLQVVHWYQHVTMLCYCWDAYATKSPVLVFIVATNFTLNSMLYGSYCLEILKIKVANASFLPFMITTIKISEAALGTFLCSFSLYSVMSRQQCGGPRNTIVGTIIYSSCLYLLFKLEYDKFVMAQKIRNRKVTVSFGPTTYFNNVRTEYYIKQERKKLETLSLHKKTE